MWPPSGRIWRSSSSVSSFVPLRIRWLVPSAQRPNSASAIAARSRGSPARPPADFALQKQLSAADAFHETAVEGAVRAVEDHRRLRQKGEHAPRRDLAVPTPGLRLACPPMLKKSSTRARALARATAVSAARKCRNQPKPASARAQAADPVSSSNGERPCALTILPPNAK